MKALKSTTQKIALGLVALMVISCQSVQTRQDAENLQRLQALASENQTLKLRAQEASERFRAARAEGNPYAAIAARQELEAILSKLEQTTPRTQESAAYRASMTSEGSGYYVEGVNINAQTNGGYSSEPTTSSKMLRTVQ